MAPIWTFGVATGALLGTTVDLVARLSHYMQCLLNFARMSRKWAPFQYQDAVTRFLQEPARNLDAGFSLQLQEAALAQGTELQQRFFCARMIYKLLSMTQLLPCSRIRFMQSEKQQR